MLPLPYTLDPNAPLDPEAVQGNFTAIATQFPLSRKSLKVEVPHLIGGPNEPVFQNSWTNYDVSSEQAARYWKDPFNQVHIQGLVFGGTPGTTSTVFVLPAGYRPGQGLVFASIASGNIMARIDVAPAGNVVVIVGASAYTSINIPPFLQEQ